MNTYGLVQIITRKHSRSLKGKDFLQDFLNSSPEICQEITRSNNAAAIQYQREVLEICMAESIYSNIPWKKPTETPLVFFRQ